MGVRGGGIAGGWGGEGGTTPFYRGGPILPRGTHLTKVGPPDPSYRGGPYQGGPILPKNTHLVKRNILPKGTHFTEGDRLEEDGVLRIPVSDVPPRVLEIRCSPIVKIMEVGDQPHWNLCRIVKTGNQSKEWIFNSDYREEMT